MNWKWAAASAIGTSHQKSGAPKQDSFKVSSFENDALFACVSDGAGSAAYSKLGSWLACRLLSEKFKDWCFRFNGVPNEYFIWQWIDEYRDTISRYAEIKGVSRRQFACTLACVFVRNENIVVMHVGDSCIVTGKDNNWDTIFWPENGEYASSTYFLTDDPSPKLNILIDKLNVDHIAVFSDGLNCVALSYDEKVAFPGFFNNMFDHISKSPESKYMQSTSKELNQFLNSERLCEHTDDDKTLILITNHNAG